MSWIRGKLADHVGDHIVLSPEEGVLVTSPGTESSHPRLPQSLNNSFWYKKQIAKSSVVCTIFSESPLQATYGHLLVQENYSQLNQFSNSDQTGLASSNELLKYCRDFSFQYNGLLYPRASISSEAYTALFARKGSHFSHDTSRSLILTESTNILSAAIQIRLS